jgi:predicted HTH transcriptional regulator
MNQNQLKKIIDELVKLPKENEYVEFKHNFFDKNETGKRISGLANSACLVEKDFAFLIFGIKDGSHEVVGTNFSAKKEKIGNIEFENWLSQKLNPKINFKIYEFEYDGKKLVLFKIPAAINCPVTFNKISYVRINSSNRELKDFPDKERDIWINQERKNYEKSICMESLEQDDILKLLDYSNYFKLTKQTVPSSKEKFIEKMMQDKLVLRSAGDNYQITNLGAVLFANNLKNFEGVSRKSARVMVYKGESRKNRIKEKEDKMGYANGFEILVDYINDQLPYNEEITKALRKERKMYPKEAIREFVANALIHQDLSVSGAGPTIEIFSNRIEITNPGVPLISVERFIDHPPRSRNQDLASFMRRIGICEEGGTGVDSAIIAIEIFQLPAPKFEIYENFTRVIIYSHKKIKNMSKEDKIRACFQHCVLKYVQGRKMTNETLRGRFGINKSNYPAASRIIRDTLDAKLIKESDRSKEYVPIWA